MSNEEFKEKMKQAKKLVEDESEPYKTEGFKIILAKLLDSSSVIQNEDIQSRTINIETMTKNLDVKKAELATKCNITVDELDNAISIKNNIVEIIAPLTVLNTDAQKHLVVTQCVLAVYEIVLGQEWVSSSQLSECLRSVGMRDLANLAQNLRTEKDLFRYEGIKRNTRYRLTSGEGRKSAFNTIHKLAKGEFNGNK